VEFGLIVLFSFISDFDVFLSNFQKDNNHRMLITHSIIPGIILCIVGIFVLYPILLIGGISYILHVSIDTFDWGTNFLGFHQELWGPKLLITKDEQLNLESYLSQYNNPSSFFDFKYYNNKVCLFIEGFLFTLMLFFLIIFSLEYILLTFGYFPLLLFHLCKHYALKRQEEETSMER